jgi:26S proteasome regulatory subunit T2
VGSNLVQKYLSEGLKLVREVFETKGYQCRSPREQEIQRTMLELLNQLDGFDNRGEVK